MQAYLHNFKFHQICISIGFSIKFKFKPFDKTLALFCRDIYIKPFFIQKCAFLLYFYFYHKTIVINLYTQLFKLTLTCVCDVIAAEQRQAVVKFVTQLDETQKVLFGDDPGLGQEKQRGPDKGKKRGPRESYRGNHNNSICCHSNQTRVCR